MTQLSSDNTVYIITMGCSKNLCDSERLIKMFEDRGLYVEHNPSKIGKGYVVINTCGFIGDAKEESIDMILQCVQLRKARKIKKLYVMGCLSQRYEEQLRNEIPEVDEWYGKFDWTKLADAIGELQTQECCSPHWKRHITTPRHSAYLKIAEGCNRFCAFCAIPLITGRYKSRPIEEIIAEVNDLVKEGVVEFNVIAQDLSYYGVDIYGEKRIAQLVDAMAQVKGVKMIRLHYAYPTDFPYDLLPVMAKHKNVCKYLDIALQHISDKVLENMRRNITGKETRELLARIRREVPGIAIRTTLMVGFPGEGEKEFEELKEFVREQRFERMGAFAYCEEEDTYAAKHFPDEILQEVKQARLDELMDIQEEISLEMNEEKLSKEVVGIFDGQDEQFYHFRTEHDSPEVDQEVLVRRVWDPKLLDSDKTLPCTGRLYRLRINEALPFDLIGEIIEEINE